MTTTIVVNKEQVCCCSFHSSFSLTLTLSSFPTLFAISHSHSHSLSFSLAFTHSLLPLSPSHLPYTHTLSRSLSRITLASYPLLSLSRSLLAQMMSAGVDSSQSPSTSMTADRTYELQVVQNPIRARMCGFGEKDRRPIDPPPIVKLTVRNADGTIEDARSLDISTYVVHADVWSADRSVPRTLVINPSSVPQPSPTSLGVQAMGDSSMSVMSMCVPTSTRNLMGSLVSSAFLLQGLDQEPGIYFIFQDLSVRSDGVFTLRFTFALLFDAENPERTPIHTEAFSEPFTIYPAKRFPGMTESTKLSKCFASQGIKIPIRKEPRVRRVPAKTSTTTTGTETASSTTHHHQDNDPNRRGSIAGYNSSTSSSSQMQEGEMDYYDDDEEDYDDDMTG